MIEHVISREGKIMDHEIDAIWKLIGLAGMQSDERIREFFRSAIEHQKIMAVKLAKLRSQLLELDGELEPLIEKSIQYQERATFDHHFRQASKEYRELSGHPLKERLQELNAFLEEKIREEGDRVRTDPIVMGMVIGAAHGLYFRATEHAVSINHDVFELLWRMLKHMKLETFHPIVRRLQTLIEKDLISEDALEKKRSELERLGGNIPYLIRERFRKRVASDFDRGYDHAYQKLSKARYHDEVFIETFNFIRSNGGPFVEGCKIGLIVWVFEHCATYPNQLVMYVDKVIVLLSMIYVGEGQSREGVLDKRIKDALERMLHRAATEYTHPDFLGALGKIQHFLESR